MKIITVIGARPQFVKAATVSKELKKFDNVSEIIVHTGQHFDTNMSETFFKEMQIPEPKYNLNINNLPHGALTGRMLEEIEKILVAENADVVLVYGDTDTTLAGALAAKKLNIKLAHVEAGLRSFNSKMPEEINRIVTDRISDILFCPTENAAKNLYREGISTENIEICGDVMKDAVVMFSEKMKAPAAEIPEKFILTTFHRAENLSDDTSLYNIIYALEEISKTIPIVCPLHPHTRNQLSKLGFELGKSAIKFIEPVGYLEMLYLLRHCELVLTDSGGLQKEAYFSEKKCVTMRTETEWTELTEYGFNELCGTSKEKIISAVEKMLKKEVKFDKNLYGDGTAAAKIAKKLAATDLQTFKSK